MDSSYIMSTKVNRCCKSFRIQTDHAVMRGINNQKNGAIANADTSYPQYINPNLMSSNGRSQVYNGKSPGVATGNYTFIATRIV